jgi:hypothetical protein
MKQPRRPFENTKIEVHKTVAEVQRLIARYGGDRFQHFPSYPKAVFQFDYCGFTISYGFLVPPVGTEEQERRRIYRVVHQAINAELEAVASGFAAPAQVFSAHIYVDGVSLYDNPKELLRALALHPVKPLD